MTSVSFHGPPASIAEDAPAVQRGVLAVALVGLLLLGGHVLGESPRRALLLLVGAALGVSLYHAAFGFTGAYRRALLERDISGLTAQMVMLAVAMVLFAPVLAAGQVFGHAVVGAVAPVSVSMGFGAFLFGVGMQMGGGCASGTLFTTGGGDVRMALVLAFFCLGGFWASLDMHAWTSLPGIGAVSLADSLGRWPAVGLQMVALLALYAALRSLGGRNRRSLWWAGGFTWRRLLHGPWPLLLGAGLLAVLNWVTLLVAGHPWSLTWGFTLWAAKAAVALGWDPAGSAFWSAPFPANALTRPLLSDNVSVMNLGIVLGALAAAALAGRFRPRLPIPPGPLLAAILGGLMLGYGSRLAYGCNIGAFFSGVASTSLHGWVWIAAAMAGNAVGVRLRPLFRLSP